jgi:3',5'-cyclic AMP phosphodiesterase CpdA
VASGDLTQRARAVQFREARAFLDSLPAPWLAVPGNHDVPLWNLLLRVLGPLWRYHRYVTAERAPLAVVPGLRVLGLDSTRRKVGGRLLPERLEPIPRLAGGDPDDVRVLVTHHPLIRRPLEGAEAALAVARQAGVEVTLAGHHHHSHVTPGVPIAIEAPSPSHCLEPAKGFYVLRTGPGAIEVEPWRLVGAAFVAAPARTFDRRA